MSKLTIFMALLVGITFAINQNLASGLIYGLLTFGVFSIGDCADYLREINDKL